MENKYKLIKGTELTQEQRDMLTWRGMKTEGFAECHSFYFKDGKPTTWEEDKEFYYPVCHSLAYLNFD
jgi:hypothetical protein